MRRPEGEAGLDFLRGWVLAGFGLLIPRSTTPCRTPNVVVFSFSPGLGSGVRSCARVLGCVNLPVQREGQRQLLALGAGDVNLCRVNSTELRL